MYVIINQSNAFDAINSQRFATEAEAEAKVSELLTAAPNVPLLTAQLLKSFTAKVEISGEAV